MRYTTLNFRERHNDLQSSLRIFKEIGIDITGFRAPYDRYTDDMPSILEKTGLVWDGVKDRAHTQGTDAPSYTTPEKS